MCNKSSFLTEFCKLSFQKHSADIAHIGYEDFLNALRTPGCFSQYSNVN